MDGFLNTVEIVHKMTVYITTFFIAVHKRLEKFGCCNVIDFKQFWNVTKIIIVNIITIIVINILAHTVF